MGATIVESHAKRHAEAPGLSGIAGQGSLEEETRTGGAQPFAVCRRGSGHAPEHPAEHHHAKQDPLCDSHCHCRGGVGDALRRALRAGGALWAAVAAAAAAAGELGIYLGSGHTNINKRGPLWTSSEKV